MSAETQSRFHLEIEAILKARLDWHASVGLEPSEIEKSLAGAQWARSQTGDELAEWIARLLWFINPPADSPVHLVFWECFHRLKGAPAKKSKMDIRIERAARKESTA